MVCRGGFRRGGFSTRPCGRYLYRSPDHPRDAVDGNVLHRVPWRAMDGCSEVITAATLPAPTQCYASSIPRLSPSSLMSSTYLFVRDPGHYRVASLSRGSHVTHGQRMVAVVAAGDSVSDRGAWPAPAGGGDDAGTRAGSQCHGECVQPGITQRDRWVMHRSWTEGGQAPSSATGASQRWTKLISSNAWTESRSERWY